MIPSILDALIGGAIKVVNCIMGFLF